jgi:arylsulfate sulfotransferase
MRPWLLCGMTAVTVLASSCGSDDESGDSGPQFISAVIAPVPDLTIAGTVQVTAKGYDSTFVRFWKDGEEAEQTPAFAFDGDTTVRVPVLGLDTAAAYTFETVLIEPGGAAISADSGSFASGSLPAWVPVIGSTGDASVPGVVALSLPDGVVMVNNAGQVVWYKYAPDAVLNNFQAHPSGQYTLLGSGGGNPQFEILNVLGESVGVLACVGRPTRFHEVLIAAGGDAWVLCDETRTMDLSSLGGVVDAQVTATVLQHLSPAGDLLFEWNAFDHFAITDLPAADRSGPSVNFTHGNGIGIESDGNLLLGFRSLSEITKINSTTGDIIWRFGGLANEFTIQNDPKGGFERQHGVRRAGPGVIQFLDNGLATPSRLVRYLVNEQTMTALMEWSFIDAPDTWTQVGGSTQFYTNGHGLVSFGREGRVIEVDPTGNRVWELTGLDGMYVFRAQRLSSLYTAGRGEPTR